MNTLILHRSGSPLYRNITGLAPFAVIAICVASAMACSGNAAATNKPNAATSVAQAAESLHADYRQQQWKRLAQKKDRDSMIAAVLLGMPNDKDHEPVDGEVNLERRLAKSFGQDPLALFTLALVCQMQSEPCAHPEYYDSLVRIAPDNAVHWLMLPNAAAPSDAQLHSAAAAPQADSHLRITIGLLRSALAGQPSAARPGVDPHELALLLRRNAIDLVPLPKFGAVVSMCKAPSAARRGDCIGLGRRLFADRSGTILTRMVGSAMLRRLVKGTAEEVAAKELRRDYVWLSEQQEASNVPYQEQLQREIVGVGEWEAWQRSVERLGVLRTPPAAWMPKDPQLLLLSEERTPAAPAK